MEFKLLLSLLIFMIEIICLFVFYFFQDGDPEPGAPFTGTNKVAYLPDTPDAKKLIDLYAKALKEGLLFYVDFDKKHKIYKTFLNKDTPLKTSMEGGGK